MNTETFRKFRQKTLHSAAEEEHLEVVERLQMVKTAKENVRIS